MIPQNKLSRLGERNLIRYILKRFDKRVRGLVTGIGDDAAVLRMPPLRGSRAVDLLVTTDVLVEGVDFDRRYCPFHQVGFKALAVNLSDIAAMGGTPRFFLVTLGLSADLSLDQVNELYEGMQELATDYQLQMIGGDVSATRGGLFVNIMVLGEVQREKAVVRSGAKAGDHLFVTGTLGDASAGLEFARAHARGENAPMTLHLKKHSLYPLLQRQFYPLPRVQEGGLLSSKRIATAMIDLSDGLATDLRHLCEESRVGALVELEAIPLSEALLQYSKQTGKDPVQYALTGGEDFELLFTVPERKMTTLVKLAKQHRFRIARIGRILSRASGIRLKDKHGRLLPFPERGYEHFL